MTNVFKVKQPCSNFRLITAIFILESEFLGFYGTSETSGT